jgi:hypothetical protein
MKPQYTLHGAREQQPIAAAPFNEWRTQSGSLWAQFHRVPAGYLVRFPNLVDFEVSADGQHVQAWAAPRVQPGTVQHLCLNQAMPLALSRQGKLVLHASAVEVDGAVLAFIGASGRGKSTLAASFATSGARFLTDDGLQLESRAGELLALPSHPSLRLWEDSERAVLGEHASTSPAVQYTHKARFLASPQLRFCDEPRPLRRTYFLGPGTAQTVVIRPIRPAAALLELVRNSFLLDIAERELLASHFAAISDLANRPMNYELDYPRRYEALDLVRDTIIRHAGTQEHAA